MELYTQASESVNLAVYVGGVLTNADSMPTVTITRLSDNTVIVNAATASTSSTGKYYYILGTDLTAFLGKYKFEWSYIVSAVTNIKTDYYDVVVGYANLQQFRDAYPALAGKTNEEIYAKEKLARKIINIYCNQEFSFYKDKTMVVRGQGSNRLFLDQRLYNLISLKISGTDDITSEVEIFDDYWVAPTLDFEPMFFPDIKRGLFEPGRYFREKLNYYVKGDFGWQSVPDSINLAALILMNDYFCDDTMLRDHGVISAQLGDRITTFSPDLLGTTGNYNVDMLLSEFTYVNVRVI